MQTESSTESSTELSTESSTESSTAERENDSPATPQHSDFPPALPPSSSLSQPDFTWGPEEVSSDQFINSVRGAYSEAVHWRRNIFSVPSGRVGKAFVSELTIMFKAYADGSALESIALTAAMLLPLLLLQKPHKRSKAREHTQCLERHLASLKKGDIETLLCEGRTIQNRLSRSHMSHQNDESTTRIFAKLMFQGKTKSALRLITEQKRGDILHLDNVIDSCGTSDNPLTVREALLAKHPAGQPVSVDTLINSSTEPPDVHPVLFESIDAAAIKKAALHTDGAAGPSGIDARGWR